MSLIKCGTDENGSYIELKRPRGETPLCFIDECGVVHDTIRIYEYKAVRPAVGAAAEPASFEYTVW